MLDVLFCVVCRCDVCVGGASCLCGLVALCTRMLRGRSPFLLHHLFISGAFQSRGGVCVLCCMWVCLVQYLMISTSFVIVFCKQDLCLFVAVILSLDKLFC